jgi:hypothetical protein
MMTLEKKSSTVELRGAEESQTAADPAELEPEHSSQVESSTEPCRHGQDDPESGSNARRAADHLPVRGSKSWKAECIARFCQTALRELDNHAVPLTVLAALLFCPRLLVVFVPAVIVWGLIEALYRQMSPAFRLKLKAVFPERWRDSRVFRELAEGMAQVRPFVLGSLYMCCIPFALVWMYAHWLMRLNRPADQEEKKVLCSRSSVSFRQNRRKQEEEEEANFFHSPAFAITCVVLFVSGLPAALTYFLYQVLGVDAMLGYPSLNPQFKTVFINIGLYIYSVGWCLSVLFFRSWFTFPLNFLGSEEELELTESGISRHHKSWFTKVLTWNEPWSGPPSLDWSQVSALRVDQTNSSLYPLPTTAFPANSLLYCLLNKLALFVDGMNRNGRREEYAYFTTGESVLATKERVNCGSSIRVNLSELSGDERAQLYYAVRKWAPQVVVDEALQERMMGTTVMQEPRYTQLWFDLLTEKMQVNHAGMLPGGAELEHGNLTIIDRLASGGQANIYLARQSDGAEVVLKEFILSTSDAVGALIESAGEFETETTLLSLLAHPRIVKMHRCFAEDRRLYIVLEKVEGVSLRRILKDGGKPLSEKETIDIALEVCNVLEYLHAQEPPVVHRDISPDNLLFNEADGIKVVDFSLAAGRKSRRTTSTMGKHSYAPPEQFRGEPCPQSDIYALGATMYFLLTGEDPRPISSSDIGARRPDVSDRLREIILRATAFNLEDRYPSVSWLKLDLEEACAGTGP